MSPLQVKHTETQWRVKRKKSLRACVTELKGFFLHSWSALGKDLGYVPCKHTLRDWKIPFLQKVVKTNFDFTLQVKICGIDSPVYFLKWLGTSISKTLPKTPGIFFGCVLSNKTTAVCAYSLQSILQLKRKYFCQGYFHSTEEASV